MRAEINRWTQAKTALIGLALTATSAIGSFGFSASSRREVLLILPFVLSGLALLYLHYSVFAKNSGDYVRAQLWPFVRSVLPPPGDFPGLEVPCWESWSNDLRRERGRLSLPGLITFLGQGIVFGVPAIGSLIVTRKLALGHSLEAIWLLGLASLAGTLLMILLVETQVLYPRSPQKSH